MAAFDAFPAVAFVAFLAAACVAFPAATLALLGLMAEGEAGVCLAPAGVGEACSLVRGLPLLTL